MLDILKFVVLIGMANMAMGYICIYKEDIKRGLLFDVLGDPANNTAGCECPTPDGNKCSPNEEVELEKLQHFFPESKPGTTECCFTLGANEVLEITKPKIKHKTFQAQEVDPNINVTCTRDVMKGWGEDIIRGFTLVDEETDSAWRCNCHHYRIKDFWLCYNQECGNECQSRNYDRFHPVSEECCI